MTRRELLAVMAVPLFGGGEDLPYGAGRRYHLALSSDAMEADPELLTRVRHAGVSDVWTTGFLYGHWYYSPERIRTALQHIRAAGMEAHVVNVPLGHPGDSLRAPSTAMPLVPPSRWRPGTRLDGSVHWGTSLHPPATRENAAAVRRLARMGVDRVFLDDDFRIAESPGTVGGCFCAQHLEQFRELYGYGENLREDLIDSIRARRLTSTVHHWVDFWCDQLGGCFRAQQSAAPHLQLGIMVMYLGAEKAGVRLPDYAQVPLRVGELMFSDRQFHPVKGKTDELFSALFHRRFVAPELAFSETTVFPSDQLSARNLAAKLATSTLADVRNTMFMSGITPFPRAYWDTLAPAMKKHATLHRQVAGHKPRGPFKHFWGEPCRYVGDDRPFSLFLATGVPFEVTEAPAESGWTFLADSDAAAVGAGEIPTRGTEYIGRVNVPRVRQLNESLPDLFRLKAQLRPRLRPFPVVVEDKPVVCAWYPTAQSVLLWNLSEQRESFTLECAGEQRHIDMRPLDVELVTDIWVAAEW